MVFGGRIIQQLLCPECGATSEPAVSESFTHVIYATELMERSKAHPHESFGQRTGACLRSAVHLRCPNINANNCMGRPKLEAYLLRSPMVMAISLAWQSHRETTSKLESLMNSLTYKLHLAQVFSISSPEIASDTYFFRGMVCYYGQHYVSVFQYCSVGRPRFLPFDDARIRVIGQWRDVLAECRRARYQPVLLLYEKDSGANDIAHLLGSDLDYSSMNDISL